MKMRHLCLVVLLCASVLGCSLGAKHSVRGQDGDAADEASLTLPDYDELKSGDLDADASGDCGQEEGGCLQELPLNSDADSTSSIDGTETSGKAGAAAAERVDDIEKDQNLLDTALDYCNASQEYWSEGNFEKAIATLDQAYTNVLKVNPMNNFELVQQKEDLRFTISKRILEIYASRYTAVNGNHKEIPLTMNKYVEREIARFQGPERKFFVASYRRSGKYIELIRKDLRDAGLPEDLAWLPLIESGFKVKALSRARALGLWQFIPSTGYKFGLKRDTWIDERLDPQKATTAAIEYMKELHQIFGDWTTVLAGYNCGEGTVLKRIRNQKINYLDNFWDLYEQLPQETAQYVPRFLATLHILRDPEKYGFTLDELESPLAYEEVEIERPVQLKAVAEELGVSFKELSDLNPELRRYVTPPTIYSLKVPEGQGEALLASIEEIPKWTPPENAYVYHRVKRGETLSLIALRYRTSVKKIVLANNIQRKHFIREGQRLKVPMRGASQATYFSNEDLPPDGLYRIKKGDSLWLIARKFNTNTKKLQRINNLQTTRLSVGQVLKISE